jgi:hypothetical protein
MDEFNPTDMTGAGWPILHRHPFQIEARLDYM